MGIKTNIIQKCEICNGTGYTHKMRHINACWKCYTTGYELLFTQKAILWYWRNFKPEFLPLGDGYIEWDNVVFPPKPWECRACNGLGYNPYEMCEDCNGSGIRWRLVYLCLTLIYALIRWYKARKWEQESHKPLSEDEIPF